VNDEKLVPRFRGRVNSFYVRLEAKFRYTTLTQILCFVACREDLTKTANSEIDT
jgi:hypothetical protein